MRFSSSSRESIDDVEDSEWSPIESNLDLSFPSESREIDSSPDTVNVLSNGTSVKLVGEKANAFAFNTRVAESIPRDVKKADIIGVVSKNYFMGRESLKIEILDLCDKSEEKPKATPFAEKLKRMAEEN